MVPVPRYVGCVGECQTSVGPCFGGFGGTGPGARKFPIGLRVSCWMCPGLYTSVAGLMLSLPERRVGAPWAVGGSALLWLGPGLGTGETGAWGNWGSGILSLCWAVAPRTGLGAECSLWSGVAFSFCCVGATCCRQLSHRGSPGAWMCVGPGCGCWVGGTCCVGGRVFDLWRPTGSLPLASLSSWTPLSNSSSDAGVVSIEPELSWPWSGASLGSVGSGTSLWSVCSELV